MALDRGLADNLAKARKARMANIEAKQAAPAKKAASPSTKPKAAAKPRAAKAPAK